MTKPDKIFLFDIDSVLVEPLGYRAALFATLRHFTDRMGVDKELLPDINTIETFEAMHITSEWDMAPLILAVILEKLSAANPSMVLPESISKLGDINPVNHVGGIDYQSTFQYLGENLVAQQFPADTALSIAAEHITNTGMHHPGLFPRLSNSQFLTELLSNSRDPFQSATTRCFQHYTLGSEIYRQVYGVNAEFQTDSLLKIYDRSLLLAETRNDLLEQKERGRLAIAAMTNRPSLPPREVRNYIQDYAPEAEMALDLIGFNQIPMISFGRIRYLSEKYRLEPESLLKPSPMQAIAAILAAYSNQELPAMEVALALIGENNQILPGNNVLAYLAERDTPQDLEIHIFEDTRWGIEATRHAGSILDDWGVANNVFAWGIAVNEQKARDLHLAGALVCNNIQQAVTKALNESYPSS